VNTPPHRGVRLLPHGDRGHARARKKRDWFVSIFIVLAILAVLVAIISNLSHDQRAVRALPQEQRHAVLSRTVDDLRQFCGEARSDALKDHCRELASFAALFQECRGECEALVQRQLAPAPTR